MPVLIPRRPALCRTLRSTLAPVSTWLKARIRAQYRTLVDQTTPLNPQRRFWLSEAIFAVENDLEHRQPSHPMVTVLRRVRNELYDDLGLNESPATVKEPDHVHT